jgi:Flp pilus assembly protein TadG
MRRPGKPHPRRRCPGAQAGRGTTGPAWPRLLSSRAGVAAMEFALLAPVVVLMLAGLYDLTMAYIAWERVTLAAQAINQIATTIAATPPNSNTVTQAQATTASTAIYAYLPQLLTASPPAFSVTISSIAMEPLTAGTSCAGPTTCVAQVAWSGTYLGTDQDVNGTALQRPCGVGAVVQTSDTTTPSPGTLPEDVYSASSLLVVDVTYQFTPTFYQFLTGNITIAQSAYYPPRIGLQSAHITYIYAAPDLTTVCSPAPA